MNRPRYKRILATIGGMFFLVISMHEKIIELAQEVYQNGFKIGALITGYILIRKELKIRQLNGRDRRWERKIDYVVDGIKELKAYFGLPTTLTPGEVPSSKIGSLLLRKDSRQEYQFERMRKKMNEYLKKLGSRKFQAFLLITITNLAMIAGYWLNIGDMQHMLDAWMPVINLLVQGIATIVYQIVQGSVDREAQKQQVYLVPPAAAIVDPAPPDKQLTEIDFAAQVEAVNTELNRCLNLIKAKNFADAPKEAIQLYTAIHDLIKGKST